VSRGRTLSPRSLEAILRERLAATGNREVSVRVIRLEGDRALVEVPHSRALVARDAWNGSWTAIDGGPVVLATHATWGTLAKAKLWLRSP
jgi:hypothetical protein